MMLIRHSVGRLRHGVRTTEVVLHTDMGGVERSLLRIGKNGGRARKRTMSTNEVYRSSSGTLVVDHDTFHPKTTGLKHRRRVNLDGLVHFRSLQEFIRTKKHVERGNLKDAFLAHGYQLLRPLGSGAYGDVYLSKEFGTTTSTVLKAIKVLNVRKARKEYDHTWLTAEERVQAADDSETILKELEALPDGIVKEHMLRAHANLQELLQKEKDPQKRRTRRPVAEHEILQRLAPHPFVANLESSFRDHSHLYMVFKYYSGGTLKDLLKKQGGRMSEDEARFYAAEMALALQFLQENNIAHRDIKPDNILLNREGHIAISDFGLATRLHGGLKTLCGTAEYIAPEVLSAKTWTSAYLDWWAFGVTVYELMFGKTPFGGPDAQTCFLNTLTAPLKFPPETSDLTKEFLSGILSRNYDKRIRQHEILKHPFFHSVNFEHLQRKLIDPPFRPPVGDEGGSIIGNKGQLLNLDIKKDTPLRRRPRIEFSFDDRFG